MRYRFFVARDLAVQRYACNQHDIKKIIFDKYRNNMVIISVVKNDNNYAECRQLALLVMGLKSSALSGIPPLSDQTIIEKSNICTKLNSNVSRPSILNDLEYLFLDLLLILLVSYLCYPYRAVPILVTSVTYTLIINQSYTIL